VHLGEYLLCFTMSRHHRGMSLVVTPLGLPRLYVLPDHDDGKQNELEQGLGDPGDDHNRVAGSESRGKRNQREDCEGDCGPHRSNDRRDSLAPALETVIASTHEPRGFAHG
jgi:hypothetical protein